MVTPLDEMPGMLATERCSYVEHQFAMALMRPTGDGRRDTRVWGSTLGNHEADTIAFSVFRRGSRGQMYERF